MKNKKGFTLIELLAVIVILAILVMLAIPAVTRYLNTARRNAFSDNALRAVDAVRNDIVTASFDSTNSMSGTTKRVCTGSQCTYEKEAIDELLENKLNTSAFGGDYCLVKVVVTPTNSGANADNVNTNYEYKVWMVDVNGNGIADMDVADINAGAIKVDGSLTSQCPNP